MGFLATYHQGHVDALCAAAGRNELGPVKTLLTEDAARGRRSCYLFARFFVPLVNACDARGWTPLHHAAKSGSWDMVRLLLGHGAALNARTFSTADALEDALTPLMVAAKYGHAYIVKNLLSYASLDFQAVNQHGMNALFFAIYGDTGADNVIMKLLIHKGMHCVVNKRKETLLIFAAVHKKLEAVRYIATDLLMDPSRSMAWSRDSRDIDGKTAYDRSDTYEMKLILESLGARGTVLNPVFAVRDWSAVSSSGRGPGSSLGARV